ncbi:hypothetical protein P6P90_10845 [Ectobacillus antri]|uniref:Uncharacterized protein n=1 Tax=Ectobacillus antri TaxID=2486280 RepID=A0ABT6H7M2_9BACI|nr:MULTISPECIES: hypothetical protein [Ectobacillus]MDG4657403.1 hypothetical protein [Ectobacillus antri]MDG5754466.1 hypothetical protein [Ectobacillus antri]UOY91936.1 hypothetical protein MUG87_15910 [Ectobacillus sp. JY-23]
MEQHGFLTGKIPAYLIGNESNMVLLSQEEYSHLWSEAAAPGNVHKGYFYNTYDHGLSNGLFIGEGTDMVAEVRNGQLYRS